MIYFPSSSLRLFKLNVIAIIMIVVIVASTFGSYLYLQALKENSVRNALFDQNKQRQTDNAKAISQHVSSDIYSVVVRLQLLASQPPLQRGEISSDETGALLKATDDDINKLTLTDGIILLDKDGNIVNTSGGEYRKFVGLDRSETEYAIETAKSLKPYISSGFVGATGTYLVAIAVPIINEETGEMLGIVRAAFPTIEYFGRYANVLDISSQYVAALDRKGNYLAMGLTDLIGRNFFSEEAQKILNNNEQLKEMYRGALTGTPSSTIFDAGYGERFLVAYPVYFDGEQVMTVAIGMPTAAVYSQVDQVLTAARLQMLVTLAAVSAAVVGLFIFVLRWNKILDTQVRQKTSELGESNHRLVQANMMLSEANEGLKAHDKMQREFINIAAHELRTPIQPILATADMMDQEFRGGKEKVEVTKAEVDIIIRNAERLDRLSSDILTALRIESGRIQRNIESFDIAEMIRGVVSDALKANAVSGLPQNKRVEIVWDSPSIMIKADKVKVYEVLSNLVRNAVKFTEEGKITITAAKSNDGNEIIVKVSDTGVGIDPAIMPRIFTKFASITEPPGGTGLGLYISKSIIEAHGGRIWAQNNEEGRGATFMFTLPVDSTIKQIQMSLTG